MANLIGYVKYNIALLLVTFLGRARKVTSRRAAPGLIWLLRSPRLNPRTMRGNLRSKPVTEQDKAHAANRERPAVMQ